MISKYRWVQAALALTLVIVVLNYQNCSPASLGFRQNQNSSTGLGTVTSPTPTPTPPPPMTSCPAGAKTAISGSGCVCPSGSNWNSSTNACETCDPTKTWDPASNTCVNPANLCKSFVDLGVTGRGSSAAPVHIPARDKSDTCYTFQMVEEYPPAGSGFPGSTSYTHMRNDIIAEDHDGVTPHPRIIQDPGVAFVDPTQYAVTFIMDGQRNLILAGDSHGTQDMDVDNFVLAEFTKPTGLSNWGSGTGDVPLPMSDPTYPGQLTVMNGGLPYKVDYYVYNPGGTATFTPVDLSRYLNFSSYGVSDQTTLRVTALDCGDIGGTSSVYLLFR